MLGFFNFLNVVVAVLSTIFIFRQLFIKFHWSNKALKNVVFSICMVITLFSSYFSSTSGLVAKEHKDNLNFETNYADTHNTPIMLQDEIDKVNKEIDKVYSYSAAEYISFVLGTLIYICILKEYKNVKKEERWDLKKIRDEINRNELKMLLKQASFNVYEWSEKGYVYLFNCSKNTNGKI